ncbi:MAG: TlpA disulfide reductase family protein [Candidatus Pelagadaptatus aseana]
MLLAVLLSGCTERHLSLHREPDITWESLRGQWLFINYWAEWCKPCIEELPALSAFDRQQASARVLGVNYDAVPAAQLDKLKQQFAIEFSLLLHDPAAELAYNRPTVLPATVVFDVEGRYIDTLYGPQTGKSLQQVMLD